MINKYLPFGEKKIVKIGPVDPEKKRF